MARLTFLGAARTRRPGVLLTHGEGDAALALGATLGKERGFPTHVPSQGETLEL